MSDLSQPNSLSSLFLPSINYAYVSERVLFLQIEPSFCKLEPARSCPSGGTSGCVDRIIN